VSDDFDGDARPIGPAPDLGADEYGTPPAMEFTLYLPLVAKGWSAPISQRMPEPVVGPTVQPADLIQPSHLVYHRAFRLPALPGDDEHSWK
jgi:hypothetical protein